MITLAIRRTRVTSVVPLRWATTTVGRRATLTVEKKAALRAALKAEKKAALKELKTRRRLSFTVPP